MKLLLGFEITQTDQRKCFFSVQLLIVLLVPSLNVEITRIFSMFVTKMGDNDLYYYSLPFENQEYIASCGLRNINCRFRIYNSLSRDHYLNGFLQQPKNIEMKNNKIYHC